MAKKPVLAKKTQPDDESPRFPLGTVLGALVLIVVTVFATHWLWSSDDSDATSEAQKRFCDFTSSLIALDYNDWDSYFSNLVDKTSGDAKETVEKNFVSQEMREAIAASQLKREVISNNCGVESATDERAELISFVVARSSNAQGSFPEQFAINGEVKLIDGDWLITKLELPVLNPY